MPEIVHLINNCKEWFNLKKLWQHCIWPPPPPRPPPQKRDSVDTLWIRASHKSQLFDIFIILFHLINSITKFDFELILSILHTQYFSDILKQHIYILWFKKNIIHIKLKKNHFCMYKSKYYYLWSEERFQWKKGTFIAPLPCTQYFFKLCKWLFTPMVNLYIYINYTIWV